MPLKRATCHALLSFGDQAVHMPLRIQYSEEEGIIPATIEGIQAGLTLFVDGSADCLDRNTDPRSSTRPLEATASWSSGEGEEALQLLKALELGPQLCQAQFRCDLSLSGHLSSDVEPEGVQVLRAFVAGSLCLRPWFHASNKTAVVEFYHAAKAWFLQGQDDKARETCEKALKLGDELRPLSVEMGDALHLLGAIHLRQKSLPLAVKCFERALVIKKVFGNEEEPSDSQISTLLALGGAQLQSGKASDALGCFQIVSNALEEREDQTVMQANVYHKLGAAHRALGQHGQALQCYQLCLELRETALGHEDLQLISPLNNLGAEAQQLLKYHEAQHFYLRALALEKKHLGARHLTTATTLGNLGAVYVQLKEPQAVPCLQGALEVQKKELGLCHPSVASTMHNLGNALASTGQDTAAAECLRETLLVWRQAQDKGIGSPKDVAATLHSLGNVYRGLVDATSAQRCFSAALQIREALLGAAHPHTARTRHCLALVGCSLGTPGEALEELNLAMDGLLQNLGSKHPWTLQARLDANTLVSSRPGSAGSQNSMGI